MTARHLLPRTASSLLLYLPLLSIQGCYRSLTPDEVFSHFILDPEPTSIAHLQGRYIDQHEWNAWLRFSVSSEDLARILASLDAWEVGWSEFDHIVGDFHEAPETLRPPGDWFRHCNLYEGVNSKGVTSFIAAKPDTGEVFVSLQQT